MKTQNSNNQFATKGDLKEVREDISILKGDVKDLKEDIREMKNDMKGLIDAIHIFSESVDKRFDKVENDVGTLKQDVTKIKATMVTKDYLDEKLGDLRGDLTVLIRKEDNKVKALVEVLVEKKVLNKTDQKKIYSLEPFAQI